VYRIAGDPDRAPRSPRMKQALCFAAPGGRRIVEVMAVLDMLRHEVARIAEEGGRLAFGSHLRRALSVFVVGGGVALFLLAC
jgi:hypothetical protein